MSLNIDKAEMDEAWRKRNESDKFYKYLYAIASHQVSRKKINIHERADYIQFCIYKCFKHQDSFDPNKINSQGAKPSTYSFFWKQISLAIAYKQRKQARRNGKYRTVYVEQEKILDWAERQYADDGESFKDIVEADEIKEIKKAYRRYNNANDGDNLKPSPDTIREVLRWNVEQDPNFLNKFSTLKNIFKEWAEVSSAT